MENIFVFWEYFASLLGQDILPCTIATYGYFIASLILTYMLIVLD